LRYPPLTTPIGVLSWAQTNDSSALVLHYLNGQTHDSFFFLQDPEGGGIADRPGDMVDVFHTLFGVAGKFFAS